MTSHSLRRTRYILRGNKRQLDGLCHHSSTVRDTLQIHRDADVEYNAQGGHIFISYIRTRHHGTFVLLSYDELK